MLDIFFSLILLIILSPVLLVVFLLVRFKLGSPALFRQERPGLHGKLFTLYKFRSMSDLKDANGSPLSDSERLTDFGKFLRGSSLDELPELLNILRGDMSFVGPRPLLVQYLERYDSVQARRHEVRPGLTGWAQVNGRNTVRWKEKFEMDVWYVDHWNLFLDVKILWMTLEKVFKREGVNAEGEATVKEFMGNDNEDLK
jgi:lipopolysaccharide/colanic/teichoic acid biosynthesis glycosyltransferase